jgi:hypothetical protein
MSGRLVARSQGELASRAPTRKLIDAMISADDAITKAQRRVQDAQGS